jgi:hypothetical protein
MPATTSTMWAAAPVSRTKNKTAQIIKSIAALIISSFLITFGFLLLK